MKDDRGTWRLLFLVLFLRGVWVQDPGATMVTTGPENRVVVDEAGENRCPGRTVTAAMVFVRPCQIPPVRVLKGV